MGHQIFAKVTQWLVFAGIVSTMMMAFALPAPGQASPGERSITTAATDPNPIPAPNPAPTPNQDPFGWLDMVSAPASGQVRITGWAIDPDTPATPVTIHAYVGGVVGIGEGHDLGVANLTRADVGAAYPGTGNNHGFDFTFSTNKTGTQPVCVYALNTVEGNNPMLQGSCKNITIAPKSLTVTFNLMGGAGVVSKTVTYGVRFALPAAPARTGYTFNGWATSSTATSGAAAGTLAVVYGPATYYATWRVIAVSAVVTDAAAVSVPVGGTDTALARVSPSSALDQTLYWTSSNPSVATVTALSQQGSPVTVTGKALGQATLTATTQDKAAKIPSVKFTVTVGMKYYALGDSFSSGEGNPPFGYDGKTACHRSSAAYGIQLTKDSSLPFQLLLASGGFRACTGAYIEHIIDSAYTDKGVASPQFDASMQQDIGENPAIVTMSIGGNDAGFQDVIRGLVNLEVGVSLACFRNLNLAQCVDPFEQSYQALLEKALEDVSPDNMSPDGLVMRLKTTYEQILGAAGTAKTRLIVVGYPSPAQDVDGPFCLGALLYGRQRDLFDVASRLDQAVGKAVAMAATSFPGQVFYVSAMSAFKDHEACTRNRYFNALDVAHQQYSFHPNAAGHAVYERLLADFIQANQSQLMAP
jgi:uncharacterized repeat protein (TIGR02543 family)